MKEDVILACSSEIMEYFFENIDRYDGKFERSDINDILSKFFTKFHEELPK